jgi:Helicase HerA, central domain
MLLRAGQAIPLLQSQAPVEYTWGHWLGKQGQKVGHFTLSESDLQQHVTVLGRTGTGKSRFLTSLITQHLEQRRALLLIDPDNDLLEDCLASVVKQVMSGQQSAKLLRRLHSIVPSPRQSFRYDPFALQLHKDIPAELLPSVRAAWLHAQVERVADVFQRANGQASFERMPRLHRVLVNVLTAVGTLVRGRHLPLSEAVVLLTPQHPRHADVLSMIAPGLPTEIRLELEELSQFKRVEDLRRETESTLNRLRAIIGPVVKSIFTSDGSEPAFRLHDAIQRGHIVLVGIRPTPYLNAEQGRLLANLFLCDAVQTALITPRAQRRPLTLMIDEAAEFASSPEIDLCLRRGRKLKLGLVLAAQTLQSFQTKEHDRRPMILSQPKTLVTFAQRWPDDLALLARTFYTGALDHEKLVQEVERDGGIDWLPMTETSRSTANGTTWGTNQGTQESHGTGTTKTAGTGQQLGWSKTTGTTVNQSTSVGSSESDALGQGDGRRETLHTTEDGLTQLLMLTSEQHNHSQVRGSSVTEATGIGTSASTGTSGGTSAQQSQGTTATTTRGTSTGTSKGGSQTTGVTVSEKLAQVRKVVRELQETGQLHTSIADQLEAFAQKIFSLPARHAVALIGSEARSFVALDQPDAFPTQEQVVLAAEWVQQKLFDIHPYLYVPDLRPQTSDERLEAFLEETERSKELKEVPTCRPAANPFDGEEISGESAG